mmetsp:Transcript_90143/g.291349  ORF Transcript_90143/g.291349 Transcript_90143/m.291349 type:complete len:269 (-) Transcript_90143:2160-2966(-)
MRLRVGAKEAVLSQATILAQSVPSSIAASVEAAFARVLCWSWSTAVGTLAALVVFSLVATCPGAQRCARAGNACAKSVSAQMVQESAPSLVLRARPTWPRRRFKARWGSSRCPTVRCAKARPGGPTVGRLAPTKKTGSLRSSAVLPSEPPGPLPKVGLASHMRPRVGATRASRPAEQWVSAGNTPNRIAALAAEARASQTPPGRVPSLLCSAARTHRALAIGSASAIASVDLLSAGQANAFVLRVIAQTLLVPANQDHQPPRLRCLRL